MSICEDHILYYHDMIIIINEIASRVRGRQIQRKESLETTTCPINHSTALYNHHHLSDDDNINKHLPSFPPFLPQSDGLGDKMKNL